MGTDEQLPALALSSGESGRQAAPEKRPTVFAAKEEMDKYYRSGPPGDKQCVQSILRAS